MELVIGIVVDPGKIVHQTATIWEREENILGLEPNAVETILWNHILRESLLGKRVPDKDRSIQGQQFREVAIPHFLRGDTA